MECGQIVSTLFLQRLVLFIVKYFKMCVQEEEPSLQFGVMRTAVYNYNVQVNGHMSQDMI